MKNFYFVITVKQDRNENIFSDEVKEVDYGYYAHVIKVKESENLFTSFDAIKGLTSANVFETKKKACEVATFWNNCYRQNGTYLFKNEWGVEW